MYELNYIDDIRLMNLPPTIRVSVDYDVYGYYNYYEYTELENAAMQIPGHFDTSMS